MKEFIRLIFNKRFRQIVMLFFIFFIQFWWLNKIKRFFTIEKMNEKYRRLYSKQARSFTNLALSFGGLLIKLGQFFSSRVDLLPTEYTDELAKLQDAVTPIKTSEIKTRLNREFSKNLEDLFSYFAEEPIAAASLGQVHEAKLFDGSKVAVKVLRPGIEQIIDIDLEALKVLILFAKRITRIKETVDLDEVYLEFVETVIDELDYVKEGKNADKFREMFKMDDGIYIPKIYWEITTEKVITMEFMEGFKINNNALLDENNIDRHALAERLLSAYLKQVLFDGFFHADPHPGNLLVDDNGKLIFLDFGMVGRVKQDMKRDMRDLIMGLVKKDAGAVVEAFTKLGFLRATADKSILLKSVQLMLDKFYGDINNINFDEFSLELREFLYSQPFQLPARTVFLGKALNTLVGLCYGLDEDFNLLEVAKPYVMGEIFGEETSSAGSLLIDEVKNTFFDLVAVPGKLNRLIDGLDSGNLRINVSRGFEKRLAEQQSYFSDRLIKAILSTGLMISGTNLLNGELHSLGLTLLVVGGLLGLLILRKQKVHVSSKARKMPIGAGPGFKKPKMHP